jgi:hypothetical protein
MDSLNDDVRKACVGVLGREPEEGELLQPLVEEICVRVDEMLTEMAALSVANRKMRRAIDNALLDAKGVRSIKRKLREAIR